MGFLKKVFGKKNKDTGDKKPDIDALLSSPDANNAIIEIDNYICKLCSWGETLELLTEPQKNFYFNQNLEREINNGGFNQYFFNSSGDNTHETILSLQAIGANKTASILQKAIDQFPDKVVSKNRTERNEIVEKIEEIANEAWNELDQEFYKYEDNLYTLNLEYIKKHKSLF